MTMAPLDHPAATRTEVCEALFVMALILRNTNFDNQQKRAFGSELHGTESITSRCACRSDI